MPLDTIENIVPKEVMPLQAGDTLLYHLKERYFVCQRQVKGRGIKTVMWLSGTSNTETRLADYDEKFFILDFLNEDAVIMIVSLIAQVCGLKFSEVSAYSSNAYIRAYDFFA